MKWALISTINVEEKDRTLYAMDVDRGIGMWGYMGMNLLGIG